MHVESLAVFDSIHESDSFRGAGVVKDSVLENNLSQIAAVGTICNSATFETGPSSDPEEKIRIKGIHGNATGVLSPSHAFTACSECCV